MNHHPIRTATQALVLAMTSACATLEQEPPAAELPDSSAPSFVAARLLFDRAGQPQAMAYSSVDGRTCLTSPVRMDRGVVVPGGVPCSPRQRGLSSGIWPAFGTAVDADHWLIASPFTGGAGRQLDLHVVRRTAGQLHVVADGMIEELHCMPAGQVAADRHCTLRGAVAQSFDPATQVVRCIVETDARADVVPSVGVDPVATRGLLMECSVTLRESEVDNYRWEEKLTPTVTLVGGGSNAHAFSRRGEAWVVARLGDDRPSFDEAGHFVAHVRTAKGPWRVQLLPSLRLASCWSCSHTSSGELLVTSIVTTQPGVHALRKARLYPFRDSAWRVETTPLGAQTVTPDKVSWQRVPDAFPVPWTVDEQGRGSVLQ